MSFNQKKFNQKMMTLPPTHTHTHTHTHRHTHPLVLLLSPIMLLSDFIQLSTRTCSCWSQKLFETFFTAFGPNISKFINSRTFTA